MAPSDPQTGCFHAASQAIRRMPARSPPWSNQASCQVPEPAVDLGWGGHFRDLWAGEAARAWNRSRPRSDR